MNLTHNMIKIFLLLLFSMNLCACEIDHTSNNKMTTNTIIMYGVGGTVVVAGVIIAAPLILPAGTIVAIQTTTSTIASQAAIFISNLSIPTKIGLGISGAKVVRPYIIETTEEKYKKLITSENTELLKIKTNLAHCLMKNKNEVHRTNLGYPKSCKDMADTLAILVGQDEFDQRIKKYTTI